MAKTNSKLLQNSSRKQHVKKLKLDRNLLMDNYPPKFDHECILNYALK